MTVANTLIERGRRAWREMLEQQKPPEPVLRLVRRGPVLEFTGEPYREAQAALEAAQGELAALRGELEAAQGELAELADEERTLTLGRDEDGLKALWNYAEDVATRAAGLREYSIPAAEAAVEAAAAAVQGARADEAAERMEAHRRAALAADRRALALLLEAMEARGAARQAREAETAYFMQHSASCREAGRVSARDKRSSDGLRNLNSLDRAWQEPTEEFLRWFRAHVAARAPGMVVDDND